MLICTSNCIIHISPYMNNYRDETVRSTGNDYKLNILIQDDECRSYFAGELLTNREKERGEEKDKETE
jgi:hypothetical protein